MKFVDLPVVDKNGNSTTIPINPNHVVMLIDVPIPSNITEADGTPIVKPGTGVQLGDSILPSPLTKKEVRELLENV